MSELVIQLTRVGFLALLWLFVLAALRVVRSDLRSASGLKMPVPGSNKSSNKGSDKKAKASGKQSRPKSKSPRQLVVTEGALAGTRITLEGRPIMIGRADDSTLVLDDDYASTRHARLSQRGQDWHVEDLGSTNGTYLDRAKVSGPTKVPIGASIRIGKTVIELRS
ncbi:hypothetical protein FHR84_004123 [Actinopolyspora biskrensis]|uniref:FHA domain-containing protein n=1 Tax=Actinopolyspora biskrensis TaxID=1470178 RepID=A0A852Z5Z5_9ACTN|nr:hypothetical protein [Actinopolyspora biskrensis]